MPDPQSAPPDPFAAYRSGNTAPPPTAAPPPQGDPFAAYRAQPLAAAPPPTTDPNARYKGFGFIAKDPKTLTAAPPTGSGPEMAGGAVGDVIGTSVGGPIGGAVGAGIGGGAVSALRGGSAGAIAGSALTQAGFSAGGQLVGRAASWPLRAVLSTKVGKAATSSIGEAIENASAKWEALRGRGAAVSPSTVGSLTNDVAQGPGRASLNAIGQSVEDAAKTGPDVHIAPVKSHLDTMGQQLQTSGEREAASVPDLSTSGGDALRPDQTVKILQQLKDQGIQLEPSHPLPGVLGRLQNQPDTIPFSDAHVLKRALDDAVNFDSPAKKQVQQITKGIRGDLRTAMAGHQPYDDATAAYQATLPLFNKGYVQQLSRTATENPEGLIKNIKGDSPTKLQMLFDVLDTHAATGGGAAAGQTAKEGIQAAWTYRNLIQPGIEKFPTNAAKLNPEFQALMYGDPAGKQVFDNLSQISEAYQKALVDEQAFKASTLAKKPPSAAQTVADVAHVALQPHSVFSLRSLGRLATGEGHAAKMSDLVEWASRSSASTQAMVGALASNTPGLALSNLARSAGIALFPDETPMAVSHEPAATPPPMAVNHATAAAAATPPPR